MLALTVLAMQIGRASGMATATADDDDRSTPWLLWIVVLVSMLLGMTTLSVVMPCAMANIKVSRLAIARLLVQTANASTQTSVELVVVSAHRGPEHIIATATGGCYHVDGCNTTRDPLSPDSMKKGARYLRLCEICG